jgi:broad specificity phosphatase PhoE
MKIGLLRHLKTQHKFVVRCDSREYDEEVARYEQSRIIPIDTTVFTDDYSICFSSTAPRAIETAEKVFQGKIISTPALLEVPLQAIFKSKSKLPLKLWHIVNRAGWFFNRDKLIETRNQTKTRAIRFLSWIIDSHCKDQNILLISHGFFMLILQSQLLKKGFKGKKFIKPEHGILYEFHL